ncbi:MAG: MutS-related protein [Bradyrhizobium sp.]
MTARSSAQYDADPPSPGVTGTAAFPEGKVVVPSLFSILFEHETDRKSAPAPPSYFVDLNIDQIVDGIVAGRDEYDLRSFFNCTLRRGGAIRYRNEVFRDYNKPAIHKPLAAFAQTMRTMRQYLSQAEKLHERFQKEAWIVDAIDVYCGGCWELAQALRAGEPHSRGLTTFLSNLEEYIGSIRFSEMKNAAAGLKRDLTTLRYKVIVDGDSFTVQRYDGEIDYSADVLETFERFKQGSVKDHSGKFDDWPDMNHVEAKILEFVSLLYPEIFARLDAFCKLNTDFRDIMVQAFDREIQFYAGYSDYIGILKGASAPFCEAEMAEAEKNVQSRDGFDLALAVKLAREGKTFVRNDFELNGEERILVVSGPNQGGKTTFARMFGQMHYLACLGCPVPGRSARILLFDALFTHFEREETIETLSGKLQDDLNRVHDILSEATSRSIVILNEIFTSTSLEDALFLGKQIIARIVEMGMLAVWVTFVDELSVLGPETVSMVSDVNPEGPASRTFRILRKPADGKSYAKSLAQKHGLTYERIIERVGT